MNLMQVLESSTQNEQNNLALENELRAELLVYKQQCLQSYNKILSLEHIIAESFKEKQLLMDENHQVGIWVGLYCLCERACF